MKNKFQIAMTLAVVFAMVLTSLALADQITSDADILLANNQASKSLGNVAPGAVITAPVSFILECNGNKHVDNGQIVNLTFSLGASTVAAGGNLSATNASIGAIPATWPDDGNNCPATPPTPINDNGDSTVTITAPSVPGLYTYVVGYTRDITAPDVTGGNTTATFTLTVVAPADSTPPIISYTVNGVYPASPNGSNGWYTSNVLVDWTVSDPESSFTTVGCADTTISSDTAGITSSCSATSAGGTSSDSVTIKRDATAPAGVSGAPNRTADNGTWYNHAVDIAFTGADATSGIASCTTTNYSGPEGSGVTVNGSCTDNAGNLSSLVASSAFNYDGSAPTGVVLSVTAGTSGLNGWYTSDVTVHTSSDADVSGVTCSVDQSQTTETAGAIFNGSCTNGAGLTTNAAPLTIKLDKTAPSATLAVTAGVLGSNGWYTNDVTVGTSGSDSISSLVLCTADQHQTTDTTGTAFNGSCTNDAGLTTNAAPLTIKRDATAPTVTVTPDGGPDHNGWYNNSVDFTTAGTDATSDIDSCSPVQTYSGPDGSGLTVNGSCTDNAGNIGNGVSDAFNYDATAPYDVTVAANRSPDSNGWYNHAFIAAWSGLDGTSGIDTCTSTNYSGPDTNAGSLNGNCTDKAGNASGLVAFAFKYDATKPTISAAVSAGTLGLNGWYVSDVTVHFTCADNLSGVVACPADQPLSTEGTGISSTAQTIVDVAGNSSDASNVVSVNIDKTKPSITITTPANGASYLLNQAVASSYGCSDATSGVATCVGSVANGVNIDTASAGAKNFTVNASDVAGNTISATNNYTVAFKICILYDQTKSHKLGSTVPLKLQLCDVNGVNYSSAGIVVKATTVSKLDNSASGVLDDSGAANSPDMNFRYDATLAGYIFNLSTKGLTTGTWKVTFTVNNVGSYFVQFDIK